MAKRTISLILVCILFLSLLGCARGASVAGNDTGSWSQVQEPDAARLEEILGEFEQYAEKGMADWQVPGMAIAIVKGNQTIYQKCFGTRLANGTDPVTPNTIFQIGSTSKAFTAALVALQVDRGLVSWDDKVIDHLPDFRMYDPWVTREFTVTDLMAQRSGLPGYSGLDLVTLGFGRDYVMHSLRDTEPETSFRSAYAYQNTLFLVASALVENETGKTWEENIHERIFQPLGMSNSSTDLKSYQQASDVAYLHQTRNGSVVALPMDWNYGDWVYIYGPAGGINSNLPDMTKWLRLQMHNGNFEGRQIISANNTIYMHTPKTVIASMPSGVCAYYGQGWIYQEHKPYPIIWHNGGTLGHKTMVAFVPQEEMGIVILSNLITELPDCLAFRFFDLYFGNSDRDYSDIALEEYKKMVAQANASIPVQPASPNPSLPRELYAGHYSHQTYGEINITDENGFLVLTAGPRMVKMSLEPWDREIFSVSEPDFSDQKGFAVFSMGPDGRADSVEVEGAAFSGKVLFNRVN